MAGPVFSIIVAGAGPAGQIAALVLAHAGHHVLLAGPAAGAADQRTTALMAPSLSVLDRLGLLEALGAEAAPLSTMRIVDATSRLVRAPTVTFRAAEIGEERFGLNITNRHLAAVLADAVARDPSIERRETMIAGWDISSDRVTAGFADGKSAGAKLALAADGRDSPTREAAGIRTRRRQLPQSALVLNFTHARDHQSVSTEFHTETGPFTQVPLPGRRSSLVWVVRPAEATELASLTDEALSLRIEQRMDSLLGRVTVEPGRQIHPLASLLPHRFAANRVALVGEAAHVFAPIGAQGLNLGIRDIEDLVATVERHAEDPGAPTALAAYDARRRPDILSRFGAVSILNRSLLSDFLPWQLARGAGLAAIDGIAPLRAILMREGMRPGGGLSGLWPRSAKGVGRQEAGGHRP